MRRRGVGNDWSPPCALILFASRGHRPGSRTRTDASAQTQRQHRPHPLTCASGGVPREGTHTGRQAAHQCRPFPPALHPPGHLNMPRRTRLPRLDVEILPLLCTRRAEGPRGVHLLKKSERPEVSCQGRTPPVGTRRIVDTRVVARTGFLVPPPVQRFNAPSVNPSKAPAACSSGSDWRAGILGA